MIASLKNHVDVVRVLYEAGADLDAVLSDGRTALMFASSNNSVSAAQYLIDHNCAINAQDQVNVMWKNYCLILQQGGWTALMNASYAGNREIVELLVLAGADTTLMNKVMYTAIYAQC